MIFNLEQWNGFKASWPGLAYLYNVDNIEFQDIYEIYYEEEYWYIFPRSPYILEFIYNDLEFYLINNHFKCCGGEENEERRRQASLLLEEYVEENLNDKNVIILGDLNDDITEPEDMNVFWNFLSQPSQYTFVDMDIALGPPSNWSFPNWPSHLDHILITNELFDEFNNNSTKCS